MTQIERIVQYMQDFGSITTMQAFTDLGICRLGARMSELRNLGYNINSEFVTSKNRYGDKVSYKKYWLGENNG